MNSKFLVWLLATIFLLAADLVRLKVDLIVVTVGPTALAAKGATSTIPMLMIPWVQVWLPVWRGRQSRAGSAVNSGVINSGVTTLDS